MKNLRDFVSEISTYDPDMLVVLRLEQWDRVADWHLSKKKDEAQKTRMKANGMVRWSQQRIINLVLTLEHPNPSPQTFNNPQKNVGL